MILIFLINVTVFNDASLAQPSDTPSTLLYLHSIQKI